MSPSKGKKKTSDPQHQQRAGFVEVSTKNPNTVGDQKYSVSTNNERGE